MQGKQIKTSFVIKDTFTISNMNSDNVNYYVNVAKSWYTIQSVKMTFSLSYIYTSAYWCSISSNNSNTHRFWLEFWMNGASRTWLRIRWRLNSSSDTYFTQITNWVQTSWSNSIEFTVKRDWTCIVKCNWQTTTYNANSEALNIIQSIMNLSNMNVYGSWWSNKIIDWWKMDVEVTYK